MQQDNLLGCINPYLEIRTYRQNLQNRTFYGVAGNRRNLMVPSILCVRNFKHDLLLQSIISQPFNCCHSWCPGNARDCTSVLGSSWLMCLFCRVDASFIIDSRIFLGSKYLNTPPPFPFQYFHIPPSSLPPTKMFPLSPYFAQKMPRPGRPDHALEYLRGPKGAPRERNESPNPPKSDPGGAQNTPRTVKKSIKK